MLDRKERIMTSQRKRQMTASDRKLLRKCFRTNGSLWTYRVLAVWYGAMDFDSIGKVKRWTNQRLAALRFLRELTVEYTFNAVYNAAEEMDGGWKHRLLSKTA